MVQNDLEVSIDIKIPFFLYRNKITLTVSSVFLQLHFGHQLVFVVLYLLTTVVYVYFTLDNYIFTVF